MWTKKNINRSETYSSSSNEQLLGEPASLLDHTNQIFHGSLIRTLHKHRRYLGKIHLEWSIVMVKLLMVHVLSPIEEDAGCNLTQDLGAREELDDLLLQAGQDIVFGQAHEFFEFSKACESGVLVLGHQEFVLVEELKHLLESNGVVSHECEGVLLRGTLVGFGSVDLLGQPGRALED